MTPVVACMVCAQPLDALLTDGLHAGVLVMALVALGVIAALGRGAMRLLREDRAALAADGSLLVGQRFPGLSEVEGSSAPGGSSKELPYVEPVPYIEPVPGIEPTPASGGRRVRG
jgi:hypothetical protein